MTAATQALAIPAVLGFWLLLKLRAFPHSTGVCAFARNLMGLDISAIQAIQQEFYGTNTTAMAFAKSSQPYLDQAITRAMGLAVLNPLLSPATTDGATSAVHLEDTSATALLGEFGTKMAMIYFPPTQVMHGIVNSGLFWCLGIWFLLTTLFLVRWLVDMQSMRTVAAKEVI